MMHTQSFIHTHLKFCTLPKAVNVKKIMTRKRNRRHKFIRAASLVKTFVFKCLPCHFRLEAEKLAAECNMRLYKTSVKEDLNVGSVFQHLAENYVNRVKSYEARDSGPPSLQIGGGRPGVVYQTGNGYGRSGGGQAKQQRYSIGGTVVGYGNGTAANGHLNGYGRQRGGNGFSLRHHGNNYGYGGGSGHNGGRRFSNYADSCTDYLSNPMFDSLHQRRYWPTDRTITLKPLSLKKHAPKGIALKNACKVL